MRTEQRIVEIIEWLTLSAFGRLVFSLLEYYEDFGMKFSNKPAIKIFLRLELHSTTRV